MKRKLKLYVWTGFQTDYTEGLAVAIARDEKQARKKVAEAYCTWAKDKETLTRWAQQADWGTLTVYPLNKPQAYAICGGG